jgi:short-subunit dehydrogenase
MRRDLKGRRLLITGASEGIGRKLAEQAAAAGARLVLAARSADKLEAVAADIRQRGGDAHAVPADITSEEDRPRLVQAAVDRLGGLDVLLNNAGVSAFGHFADSSEELMRRMMEVNFFGPAELTRLAIPHLMKGRQPAILNVASMCGRRGMPSWGEYSASKFALCGLTEALRGEMVRFGIDVLLVVPGLTQSELWNHLLRNEGRMRIPIEEGMTTDEAAAGILRALVKNKTETILGGEAWRLLTAHKFIPWILERKIAERVRQLYSQPAPQETHA